MPYQKPNLHALDLTTAAASCTPAPYSHEECTHDGGFTVDLTSENPVYGGTYVTDANGAPTCARSPNVFNPGQNVDGTRVYLCLVTGGIACL